MSSDKNSNKFGEIEDIFKSPDPAFVEFSDFESGKRESLLEIFDTNNPDINLLDSVDGEVVSIAGTDVSIYKWHGSARIDDLYDEERVKLISPVPVIVRGTYDPQPVGEDLTEFGLEISHDNLFIFNRTAVREQLGRSPVPGDLLRPAFSNTLYEVYEVQETDFEIYGVYHLAVSTRIWRDTDHFRKLRQSVPIDKTLILEEGAPLVEQTLLLEMSDGYQHLIDVRYVDDTLYNIRLALNDGSHTLIPTDQLKKPVMWVPHGGPSARWTKRPQSLLWAQRGFFTINIDVRGRGESQTINSALNYGRVFEDGLRDRLDHHEILHLLNNQEYLIFVRYDFPGIPYRTLKTAVPSEDDPIQDHFDMSKLCSEGFSLGGGVTMFVAGDSKNLIPSEAGSVTVSHGRKKGEKLINPATGQVYKAGDRFPKYTAAIGGGAYADAELHVSKKDNEFFRMHWISFVFGNPQYWPELGVRQYERDIVGFKISDWFTQGRPRGIHLEHDTLFMSKFLGFSGMQPLMYEDEALKIDPSTPINASAGDALTGYLPQGIGFGFLKKLRRGEKFILESIYPEQPNIDKIIPWNTIKLFSDGPNPKPSYLSYHLIESLEDTEINLNLMRDNFTDKFGHNRLKTSNVPLFWYQGFDDIFMDPGADIEGFVKRMEVNPSETYYHCTHGGVHGVSNAKRKKYGEEWAVNFIEHHTFGVPYMGNYGGGSEYPIWMDIVPNTRDEFVNRNHQTKVVKLKEWPPSTTEVVEIPLNNGIRLMNDSVTESTQNIMSLDRVPPEPYGEWSEPLDHRLKWINTSNPAEKQIYSMSAIENFFFRAYPNLPDPVAFTWDINEQGEGFFGSSVLAFQGPTLTEEKLLLGYVEVDLEVSAYSNAQGNFQVAVNLWEVKSSGEARYVTGGSWTTAGYITGLDPIQKKTFNLDLYCYELEKGSTLVVQVQNLAHKRPPYEYFTREETQFDGDKFYTKDGVFSTMPLPNDFSFRVGGNSKVRIPINNSIPKERL